MTHLIPFTPGFPGDWPVRPANFLQLDWLAHTRNFIHIWLPEGVATDTGQVLFILQEVVNYHFTRPEPGLWVQSYEKAGVIALRAECRAVPDGVALALEVSNRGERDWEQALAGICVQLAAAPDFADEALARTFAASSGRLVLMRQPEHRTQVTHFYQPLEDATENFIAVASKTPGYVVAQWWEGPPASLGGNCHPSIACIHAQPTLGAVAAGDTVRREGRLYLMPGTVEDAYQRYRREHGAG